LDKEKKIFKVGTKAEAESQGWVSMESLKKEYQSEEALSIYLYSKSSFTKAEIE
jgi:hypothetical protein